MHYKLLFVLETNLNKKDIKFSHKIAIGVTLLLVIWLSKFLFKIAKFFVADAKLLIKICCL